MWTSAFCRQDQALCKLVPLFRPGGESEPKVWKGQYG